jgi:hypothetical protein
LRDDIQESRHLPYGPSTRAPNNVTAVHRFYHDFCRLLQGAATSYAV